MSHTTMELSADPAKAVAELLTASHGVPVVVFKKSPICPVSFHAESEYRSWLADRDDSSPIQVVEIDVIAEKALARGLTAELGIQHQSPQALIFRDGALSWHGSHESLSVERFRGEVDR